MALTGDSAALDALISGLHVIGSGELTRTVSRNLAEEAIYQVQEGFQGSHDPMGNDWQKLGPWSREGGRILRDKGHLLSSFHVFEFGAAGFRIGSELIYAAVHQFGAVIVPKSAKRLAWKIGAVWHFAKKVTIPARPMLPPGDVLPPAWGAAFAETAKEVIDAYCARLKR